MDERGVEAAVDLAPQAAHVDVDDVGLGVEVVVPYRLEQHGAGHHLPGVAHQVFEQPELAGLELDGTPGPPDGAREKVHLQVRDHEPGGRRPVAAAPPRQRLDPGRELGEREGLDEIVVAARAQALHPVVDLAEGAQHEHRGRPIRGAQRAHDRQAVEPGEHPIDDDHVVAGVEGEQQPFLPVAGVVDHVPRLFEPLADEAGGLRIVFDEEDAHRPDCASGAAGGRERRLRRPGSPTAAGAGS